MVDILKRHDITLQCELTVLRPMSEGDWERLLRWNNDPEVLYFAEGDEVIDRSADEVRKLYRSVCRNAFCFMIVYKGVPIGECWLQKMNLERILKAHPGMDCRRIDLMIGEKDFWGQGIGTQAIELLTSFGFEEEGADVIFGCDVADYNPRSIKAFQRVGFEVCNEVRQTQGSKAESCYDLILTREKYMQKGI